MTKFSNVIVRRPAKSMVEGITSAPELGKPDYEKALKQHDDYIAALKECGVEVTVLPALEPVPRLLLRRGSRGHHALRRHHHEPGRRQPQRREGRDRACRAPVLRRRAREAHREPGHAGRRRRHDGGRPLLRGQSARTNERGIRQFCEILQGWGLEGSESEAGEGPAT